MKLNADDILQESNDKTVSIGSYGDFDNQKTTGSQRTIKQAKRRGGYSPKPTHDKIHWNGTQQVHTR